VADEKRQDKEPGVGLRDAEKLAFDLGLVANKNGNLSQISLIKQLLIRGSFLYETAIARLRLTVAREFETGIAFHFSPIFLSIGILIYYSVPHEPFFSALAITSICLIIALRLLKLHGALYYVLIACLCTFLGMLFAKFEVTRNAAPMIERQVTTELRGIVLNVDQNTRSAPRYLIKPISLGVQSIEQLPRTVRASALAKHEEIFPGDTIVGRVRLQPVTGPVYPGGYDFSFFAWQKGLGGSGFFMGKPERGKTISAHLDWQSAAQIHINLIRKRIAVRIKKALPDYTGGIAVALITGDRTGIPQKAQENLRRTGLAHILAISGLHMALVSLTLITTIRFILSRNVYLTLNYPIKKWAVIAGFLSATIYLTLSGGAVATQRAWIMISVMLMAILLDRRGITIRSVVISAIIILIISPSSLMSPGFQMSFAAVASLVAGYELINNQRQKRYASQLVFVQPSPVWRLVGDVGKYFAGIATTSLIAGTATAFIAAWHFHQVAPFGLVANLFAMPIVALMVMPSLLAAMIFMPYGLEFMPLAIASIGIDWIINIAAWIEMQSPNGNTGLVSRYTLIVFAIFLAMLTLMKTRLRYLSLFLFPVILIGFQRELPPDIIIAENGRAIGVKSKGDKLVFLYPRASKFTLNIWEKAWGRAEKDGSELEISECTREQCVIRLSNGKWFYLVYNPDLLQSACGKADILAAPRLWWVNCKNHEPELILKRHDFEQYGTHSIHFEYGSTQSSIKVVTALPEPSRPWNRRVSEK